MSSFLSFAFEGSSIRVISDDIFNPLFVAYDVAAALGYARPEQAITDRCKGSVKRVPLKTKGGVQQVRVIDEPNMYRLIFGSKLESAERLQDWVFEEVLPAIRKTGSYSLTINAEQQQQIRELIARVSNETSKGYGELYARFHNRFKIPRYQELPANRFGDAIEYLSAKLPKQQMFYGLTDGRYLLHIENGQSLIKDVSDYSLIKPEHVWAFRRNLKLLAEQSRLFMGEAGEELIAQELERIDV